VRYGRTYGFGFESVHDHRGRALALDRRPLLGPRRRRDHFVTARHEQRHEPPPDDPGSPRHEHPHDRLLPVRECVSRTRDETALRPVTSAGSCYFTPATSAMSAPPMAVSTPASRKRLENPPTEATMIAPSSGAIATGTW